MGRSRIAVALGVAAVPLAIACQGLVGLDDFERTQCPGAICSDGGLEDVANEARSDVVVVNDGGGAAPVRWARWKMPNYDAGPGTANPVEYVVATDNIRENKTRLVWQKAQTTGVTYASARSTCANLVIGQDQDWRLPSRIELVTLLDLARTPRIDPAFTDTQAGPYWTASEVRPFVATSAQYWVVNFNSGNVEKLGATQSASVRCVKGAP